MLFRKARTTTKPEVVPRRPGPRGWSGWGRGEDVRVEAPAEYRGTTVQVCGLWPWVVGSGTPMIGVPLGRHTVSGTTLCCDPISWFQRANLIANPSVFILGKPGLGKSTVVRRMATGLAGYGVMPLVLGDSSPPTRRSQGPAALVAPLGIRCAGTLRARGPRHAAAPPAGWWGRPRAPPAVPAPRGRSGVPWRRAAPHPGKAQGQCALTLSGTRWLGGAAHRRGQVPTLGPQPAPGW